MNTHKGRIFMNNNVQNKHKSRIEHKDSFAQTFNMFSRTKLILS